MTEQEWLNGNQLSLDIWNKKYRNEDETFEEFLDRICVGQENIKDLIRSKKFIFGGRILANRGIKNKKGSLSNCYVLPAPEDNLESILECAKQMARTFSYGGGVGIDLSNLRPRGAITHNAAKESTGPVSFMDLYSQVTQTISQNGRRGATMISLSVNHPDIEEFIDCKTDLERVKYANISVRVTNNFMNAVKHGIDRYLLSWPCDKYESGIDTSDWKDGELHEVNGIYYKIVNPVKLFQKLAENNWNYAEPGILYWNNIEEYNMLDNIKEFKYAGVNPCAEEPLPAGGSCLLGSINLGMFVKNPFTKNASIDWNDLETTIIGATMALNQVLIEGLTLHPLSIQQETVRDWKQIGLGTMGLAEMLIKLGIKYGSEESINLIKEVYRTIAITAIQESLSLAEELGCYPKCDKEKLVQSNFIKALGLPVSVIDNIKKYGLYNSQLLTCAPTGSIGTMFETSTGVEPYFALSYTRKTQSLNGEDTYYQVDSKIVEDYKKITKDIKLPDYFVTSAGINSIDRIKVQAALQKYTDASISSTINLPKEVTINEVYDIYLKAWEEGLKGVTIYRSGCKREGILTTNKSEKKKELVQLETTHNDETPFEFSENPFTLKRGEIIKADDDCIGLKRTLTTGCGTLHCESFWDPDTGELREIYLSKGSKGGCNNFMIGLSRMISLSARGGISIDDIIDQLNSCGVCPSYAVRHAVKKDTSSGSCCPVAVGNALKDMYEEIQERIQYCHDTMSKIDVQYRLEESLKSMEQYEECPSCHKKGLTHVGGCDQCILCGWSRCS